MIILQKPDYFNLYSTYFKLNNKWGVVAFLPYDENLGREEQIEKLKFSLPLWNQYWKDETALLVDAYEYNAVFLCDNKEEAFSIFEQIRGKDGLPTDRTPGYCYAVVYNNEGVLLTENC